MSKAMWWRRRRRGSCFVNAGNEVEKGEEAKGGGRWRRFEKDDENGEEVDKRVDDDDDDEDNGEEKRVDDDDDEDSGKEKRVDDNDDSGEKRWGGEAARMASDEEHGLFLLKQDFIVIPTRKEAIVIIFDFLYLNYFKALKGNKLILFF